MRGNRKPYWAPWMIVATIITLWSGNLIAASPGQAQDDEIRDIRRSSWYKNRPSATKQPAAAQPIQYRRKSPKMKSPAPVEDAEIGITIWRLRPSMATDEREVRELIQESGEKKQEMTPERLEAETPLKEGERVRLSIETPRQGYLYVVNRARYADGTFGLPYLIFPTLRPNGGGHDVRAGRPIEVPARTDSPPYFTLRRSKSAQGAEEVGEELIVLLTPEPLADVKIGESRLKLTSEQLALWEQQWGAETEWWELIGGADKTYTKAEKAAAEERRGLVQEDPYPQTIYTVAAKPRKPLLVSVRLPIGN